MLWIERQAPSKPKPVPDQYPLLEKTLGETNSDKLINFDPLRTQINDYFSTNIKVPYSFYLEYLPTGTSIRAESDDGGLVGASLLKLPITMDLYKADELGRLNLDDTVTIKQEWLDSNFGDLYKQGAGTKITLREAARQTLQYSDNTALNTVYAYASQAIPASESAINEIDAPFSVTPTKEVKITAKSYGSILKCLYYSCYDTPDDSQAILNILTHGDSYGRIEAGVPSTVKVAHKIGTFSNQTESDCGIIYIPKRHYVFCMMVNEADPAASNAIKDVSALAYQYILNR
ncbi:MAG: beta-lactamase protein [Candidatus Saccharibacteria bacterium]|nr:beta-lactamase protein [Candidatus Saccharibacteria bacterium]